MTCTDQLRAHIGQHDIELSAHRRRENGQHISTEEVQGNLCGGLTSADFDESELISLSKPSEGLSISGSTRNGEGFTQQVRAVLKHRKDSSQETECRGRCIVHVGEDTSLDVNKN